MNDLQLLKWDTSHVEALLRGKNDLAALLQVSPPMGWPQFLEAFTLPTVETESSSAVAAKWGDISLLTLTIKHSMDQAAFMVNPIPQAR